MHRQNICPLYYFGTWTQIPTPKFFAAFNLVYHEGLWDEVLADGTASKQARLIKSYFTGTKTSAHTNGEESIRSKEWSTSKVSVISAAVQLCSRLHYGYKMLQVSISCYISDLEFAEDIVVI